MFVNWTILTSSKATQVMHNILQAEARAINAVAKY